MTDNDSNNEPEKKDKHKIITLTHRGGTRWNATFDGVITRRDIQRLQRVITVEFTKHERQRRIDRLEARHKLEREKAESTETETVNQETKKNVYRP